MSEQRLIPDKPGKWRYSFPDIDQSLDLDLSWSNSGEGLIDQYGYLAKCRRGIWSGLVDELSPALPAPQPERDPLIRPSYYLLPNGIECKDVVRYFDFQHGNAIKYIWRAGRKGNAIDDLCKARQILDFIIEQAQQQWSAS